MSRIVAALGVAMGMVASAPSFAQAQADKPAPKVFPGEKQLYDYFRVQVKQINDACLADVRSKEEWEKRRPELRRQFLEMVGLSPMPVKTDLKATITGKVKADTITVEKLHFQSLPGLYVTASLFLPKEVQEPLPTILYLCGHGSKIKDGVSFGNKAVYQKHGIWFAENGYVCLMLDTLSLGEIRGIHHGTHPSGKQGAYWWWALGYTPAGIECWNAIRALDYLETRKEVDPKRFGVTGRSGGGAYSWWIAAADDRPTCIVPVAGIADLYAHIVEGAVDPYKKGVINGHCDCMFFHNTYRWDYAQAAALCAPRPLLLGNSDNDPIFPVAGYRNLAAKVRPIYELYDAADKFQLLETKGGHVDTPPLRTGAFRWFNRWLKNSPDAKIVDVAEDRFEPEELRVFDKLPDDAINTSIQETFIKPVAFELPESKEVAAQWWEGRSKDLLETLKERCFRGWPTSPPELNPVAAKEIVHDGIRLRAWDFVSEEAVSLRVWLVTTEKVEKPTLTVLNVLDEKGWSEWLGELGPEFQELLQTAGEIRRDDARFAQLKRTLEFHKWAFAYVAPRGIGPTRWADPGTADEIHIRRRFYLLGQTLEGQRIWDVRRAFAVLRNRMELKDVPIWIQGKGNAAVTALYAALYEPDVKRIDLWNPPASHRQGPPLLNVLRVLDLPQALALAAPRPLRLYVEDDKEAKRWEWTRRLEEKLGRDTFKIRQVGEGTDR